MAIMPPLHDGWTPTINPMITIVPSYRPIAVDVHTWDGHDGMKLEAVLMLPGLDLRLIDGVSDVNAAAYWLQVAQAVLLAAGRLLRRAQTPIPDDELAAQTHALGPLVRLLGLFQTPRMSPDDYAHLYTLLRTVDDAMTARRAALPTENAPTDNGAGQTWATIACAALDAAMRAYGTTEDVSGDETPPDRGPRRDVMHLLWSLTHMAKDTDTTLDELDTMNRLLQTVQQTVILGQQP